MLGFVICRCTIPPWTLDNVDEQSIFNDDYDFSQYWMVVLNNHFHKKILLYANHEKGDGDGRRVNYKESTILDTEPGWLQHTQYANPDT